LIHHAQALEAAAAAAALVSAAALVPSQAESLNNGGSSSVAVGVSFPRVPSPVAATVIKSRISASFELLSAVLMRDGVPLTRMAVTAARCTYESECTGKLSGKLGDFVVEDMRRADLHFPEKLGLRDKSRSVMEFEFQTFDTGGADFPGHEYFLSLEMSSTRLVYVKDFIEDLRRYMAEEPLIRGIMGKTATAVAESAKKAAGHHRRGQGLTKVSLKLVNPQVIVLGYVYAAVPAYVAVLSVCVADCCFVLVLMRTVNPMYFRCSCQ
jgi:hypothetical protein